MSKCPMSAIKMDLPVSLVPATSRDIKFVQPAKNGVASSSIRVLLSSSVFNDDTVESSSEGISPIKSVDLSEGRDDKFSHWCNQVSYVPQCKGVSAYTRHLRPIRVTKSRRTPPFLVEVLPSFAFPTRLTDSSSGQAPSNTSVIPERSLSVNDNPIAPSANFCRWGK